MRPANDGTARVTSLEKALEVCEALSSAERGLTLSELGRSLGLPRPTVHRLLSLLKRRGYVRQDEETSRYSLTLKMLDLSFRLLGRSELRLHAYPVIRERILKAGGRAFLAVPARGEVTYVWAAGPDEIAMHTVYGREMPGHCAVYFGQGAAARRLSCLRLSRPAEPKDASQAVVRLGAEAAGAGGRMACACAPVVDYTGREVARVGLFAHRADDAALAEDEGRGAWELARLVSLRLGYLQADVLAASA